MPHRHLAFELAPRTKRTLRPVRVPPSSAPKTPTIRLTSAFYDDDVWEVLRIGIVTHVDVIGRTFSRD